MMGFQWDWGDPPDPKSWQLLSTVAKREPWAIEHGLLAAKISGLIAGALTLPEGHIEKVSVAGFLHDAGKLILPAPLLQKPKPLTEDEYSQVQRHPSIGARITTAMHLPSEVIEAIRHHHERFDGRGYPFGKRGDEIPLEGRIAAVAELLSAALTPRWYRPPLTPMQAVERLQSFAGSSLDPEIVKAALHQLPKLFGFSSLSSLSHFNKPIPLERLVQDEEATLWYAVLSFVQQLLAEMEALMGRQFCQTFANWLNQWLSQRKIPLQFRDLRLVSQYRWWQTIGDLAQFARTVIGAIHSSVSQLVGAPFASKWLDAVRAQLPEQADTVGLRYGLWVWRNDVTSPTAVNS
ncbi:MAG: HD-GYP domain-containing protein [Candidatus Fervidibacter sp.]|uniref:HD-GYP domain-containing protein n=1 Tax=Candidatus Fervidibacter sp. TaxID=3100871 RepID=UPI00404B931F